MEKPDKKAMRSESAGRVYGKHSGYRKLKAYQVAELCYDFTCRFCGRYIHYKDRHHDQMVQAARRYGMGMACIRVWHAFDTVTYLTVMG